MIPHFVPFIVIDSLYPDFECVTGFLAQEIVIIIVYIHVIVMLTHKTLQPHF